MNHRIGSTVFGIVVGLLIAVWSFQWVSDPEKRAARLEQERIVELSRDILQGKLDIGELDIVDPLDTDRSVGKVYIYPGESGWEISGYYRRDEDDDWHPYLMQLTDDESLRLLKVQDGDFRVVGRSVRDPTLEIVPP